MGCRCGFFGQRVRPLPRFTADCTHDNPGEVPNLFGKDEVVAILEGPTPRAKRPGGGSAKQAALPTPAGLWAFFLHSVRANLHLVLTIPGC